MLKLLAAPSGAWVFLLHFVYLLVYFEVKTEYLLDTVSFDLPMSRLPKSLSDGDLRAVFCFSAFHSTQSSKLRCKKDGIAQDDEWNSRNLWPCREITCRNVLGPRDAFSSSNWDPTWHLDAPVCDEQRVCPLCGTYRGPIDFMLLARMLLARVPLR